MTPSRGNVEQLSADAVRSESPSAGDSTAAFAPGDTAVNRIPAASPATTFGRYELRRLLGQGGMGEVHLAFDTMLQRVVALKIPKFTDDNPQHRERFLREARAAALLSHPNICPVHDVGEVEQRPYLTMTFVDGPSLSQRLRQDGPLAPEEAARIVRAVALAMQHAHGHGIVHRDLKPGNILLNSQGEPVVMDFGLAFRFDTETSERLTEKGLVVGTPSYMPPEQINGQTLGPASDVYSLGVVLYELLTGKVPFDGPLGKLISQIESAPPPPPTGLRPDIPAGLEAICLKALAKRPGERFVDMSELAAALEDYPVGRQTLTRFAPATMAFRRPSRRRLVLAVGIGVLLLAAAATAAYLLSRPTPGEAPVTNAGSGEPAPKEETFRDKVRRLLATMDTPVKKVNFDVDAEKPTRLDRAAIPKALLKDHGGGLYFQVAGAGHGHLIDLRDQLGQGGQVTKFGPGEVTVLGTHLFFVGGLNDDARFYFHGQPPYCVLAPMNGGTGSNHIEFDGTHLLFPKLDTPKVDVVDASKDEISRLRNAALTKKITWEYATTKYVIYARPSVGLVPGNHEERRKAFPDIYNLIEYDRQRQNTATIITFPQILNARQEEREK